VNWPHFVKATAQLQLLLLLNALINGANEPLIVNLHYGTAEEFLNYSSAKFQQCAFLCGGQSREGQWMESAIDAEGSLLRVFLYSPTLPFPASQFDRLIVLAICEV